MRGDERRRIAELKRFRRVHLGETLALVFENRDTIRSTLEEALRTERIDDPDRVAGELAAFNAVVPAPGELAAVLFLEVADPADLAAAAAQPRGRRAHRVPRGRRDPGPWRSRGGLSARGELRRRTTCASASNRSNAPRSVGGSAIAVGTDHPNLTVLVHLDEEQRQAIAADL